MALRDFLLMFCISMFWGGNFIVMKFAMTGIYIDGFDGAEPFFFGAVRFGLLFLLMFPFLRPVPKNWPLLVLVGLCAGGLHLFFLYWGMSTADSSAAGIASQLVVPFTAFLSIVILREKFGIWRALGIGLAFGGAVVLAWKPGAASLSFGLSLTIIAFGLLALGSVIMKRVGDVNPWQYLAYMALAGSALLAVCSALFEDGQMTAIRTGGWEIWALWAYSVITCSIIGHGGYYFLVRKYNPTLIVTLNLMQPLWSVSLGVLIFGEVLTPLFWLGALLVIGGMIVIVWRQRQKGMTVVPIEGD